MDQPEEALRTSSLAALMRAARSTYAEAVRGPLAESGFEDIPRDGVFALSAIGLTEVSGGQLGRWLGVSKQAVSQLLDTLVLRGYVERSIDPADRRRMRLTLTDRGTQVAALCRKAVERVEHRVAEIVGAAYVEHTRATLLALIELRAQLFDPTSKGLQSDVQFRSAHRR
jgi:DNA-binding MarR family transcriptional regulator